MVVIKKKGSTGAVKWKTLQLNESMLAKGIEGLIGIEELTDYTLIQKKRTYDDDEDEPAAPQTKVVRVRVPRTKLRESLAEESAFEKSLPVVGPAVPVTKKKKKRNPNRHKKKKNPPTAELTSVTEDEQLTLPADNSASVINEVVVKRKKVKVKKKGAEVNYAAGKEEYIVKPARNKSMKRNIVEPLSNEPFSKKKRKTADEVQSKKAIRASNSTNLQQAKAKVKNEKNTVDAIKLKKDKLKMKKSKAKKKPVLQETEEEEIEVLKPVRGMEGWAGLNLPDSILRALSEKGFKEPTEIQARSLPAAVLGRRDIMGAAETGSGKTLAFGIPIIYGILQQKRKASSGGNGVGEHMDDDATSDAAEPEGAENEQRTEADSDSGGEEEVGVDADGIGCVRVVDNVVFDEDDDGQEVAATKPVNPAYNQRLYALVLTPTRELAIQVKDHLEVAAKYTGIRVAVVVGGLAHQKQERLLRTKPEIVVATPGRLWELIQEGNPYLQQVNDISYLAIDETDRMVERGHFQELQELLARVNEDSNKAKRRQNFVFSATLTMVHEPPQRKKGGRGKGKQMRVTPGQKLQDVVAMLGITRPKVVDVTRQAGTALTLREAQIRCSFDQKDVYLYHFLTSHPGRTLVFCNSISCVRRLAQLLTLLQCRPLPIHASMAQRQRLRNLDKFVANPTSLLLATDVAARGLDIPNVQHVVHYQVPRTSEGYVHRSGRTARASKDGLTLLLVEPEEQTAYARLCRTLGRDKELPAFEVSQDLLTAAKQRVKLAREIDQLELTSRRSDAELGWFQKALTDMDMVLDKDDLYPF